jgi:hypothetical protein
VNSAALAIVPPSEAPDARAIESVLISGDLSKLSAEHRVSYYNTVCHSLGLNPLTKPFAYITLNGKLVLYALKDATEQLRKLHGVSITEVTSSRLEDVFVVTAKAQDRSGRTDAATGAVAIGNLKGESLANALMKAETKAKRRATLSICGLGMLDETEAEALAQPLVVEAPKRVTLPAGTVQILSAKVTQWGGDIVAVDEHGVLATHKTTERQVAELCEALAQEAVPVTLDMQEITRGVNKGKQKLVGVHRYQASQPVVNDLTPEEHNAIDAELAAKESVF